MLEQIGPARFSRLNGIAGYKKSEVKTGKFWIPSRYDARLLLQQNLCW